MQFHRQPLFVISLNALSLAITATLVAQSHAIAMPLQAPGGADKAQVSTAPTAGGVTVQIDIPKDAGGAEYVTIDAEKAARKYVQDTKKWKVGSNDDPKPGFILQIAWAPIVKGSNTDASTFDQRRRQAAQEAMLKAKQELVKYLAAEVSTAMKVKYVEGTPSLTDIAAAQAKQSPAEPGAIAKLSAIMNFEINEQLKKRGIDPSLKSPEQQAKAVEAAKQAAKEVMAQSDFSSTVNLAAEHELSGLQAFRTFENMGSDGEGKIAVVAVYSSKSSDLQRALLGQTGGVAPKGTPSDPVMQWAESQGPDVLLYTHGVQIRTDERGELVLVAFGQSSPVLPGARGAEAAQEKANLRAFGEMRRFFNALVASAQIDSEASSMKQYADQTSEFKSESSYSKNVSERTKNLEMPGILPGGYTWSKRHPQSDRETQGCVLSFSVSEMVKAKELRELFKAAGGAEGGVGGSNLSRPAGESSAKDKPQPKQPLGGSSSGKGAEGVEP
jgi:hypothetical protein